LAIETNFKLSGGAIRGQMAFDNSWVQPLKATFAANLSHYFWTFFHDILDLVLIETSARLPQVATGMLFSFVIAVVAPYLRGMPFVMFSSHRHE
jgi:hypothetical protein